MKQSIAEEMKMNQLIIAKYRKVIENLKICSHQGLEAQAISYEYSSFMMTLWKNKKNKVFRVKIQYNTIQYNTNTNIIIMALTP